MHREKMAQMLLAYGLPKETAAAIMMLYKKIHSPYGDIDFFDIGAGILQGDTLVQYLSIICLDYILRTLIDLITENGFTLRKARSTNYYKCRLC